MTPLEVRADPTVGRGLVPLESLSEVDDVVEAAEQDFAQRQAFTPKPSRPGVTGGTGLTNFGANCSSTKAIVVGFRSDVATARSKRFAGRQSCRAWAPSDFSEIR